MVEAGTVGVRQRSRLLRWIAIGLGAILVPVTPVAASALARASTEPGATFAVTSAGDTGPGSLRQAILDANARAGFDRITFDRAESIRLDSALPAITDAVAVEGIGGVAITGPADAVGLTITTNGASVRAVRITGFAVGIEISGSDNTVVATELDHNGVGIRIAGASRSNRIGGAELTDGNTVTRSDGAAIEITGPSEEETRAAMAAMQGGTLDIAALSAVMASGNSVVGNRLGVEGSGAAAPNHGPAIAVARTTGTTIPSNTFGPNDGPPIVRDERAASRVLDVSAERAGGTTRITGVAAGTAGSALTIEFYAARCSSARPTSPLGTTTVTVGDDGRALFGFDTPVRREARDLSAVRDASAARLGAHANAQPVVRAEPVRE